SRLHATEVRGQTHKRPPLLRPHSTYSQALQTAFELRRKNMRDHGTPRSEWWRDRARLPPEPRVELSTKTWHALFESEFHRRRQSHKAQDEKGFFRICAEQSTRLGLSEPKKA